MEAYTEISNKLLHKIEQEGYNLNVPSGVTIKRKQGSRVCYFECDDSIKNELIDFLDDNGINWQDDGIEQGFRDFKDYRNTWKEPKESVFKDIKDPWYNQDKAKAKKIKEKEERDKKRRMQENQEFF